MEMTGCPEDGVGVDDGARGVVVTPGHVNPVHIRWHKALFHIELGQYGAALALYDGRCARWHHPVAGLAAVSWWIKTDAVDDP